MIFELKKLLYIICACFGNEFECHLIFQHHVTDLEARLALKDAEAADLRQRLARNGTVVSDVNGGYYGVKTH